MAGGDKYLVNNIVFKFAVDSNKIYNGDHWFSLFLDFPNRIHLSDFFFYFPVFFFFFRAAKAAGLELLAVSSYYNTYTPGLALPLTTLVNFLGYRLIATSRFLRFPFVIPVVFIYSAFLSLGSQSQALRWFMEVLIQEKLCITRTNILIKWLLILQTVYTSFLMMSRYNFVLFFGSSSRLFSHFFFFLVCRKTRFCTTEKNSSHSLGYGRAFWEWYFFKFYPFVGPY